MSISSSMLRESKKETNLQTIQRLRDRGLFIETFADMGVRLRNCLLESSIKDFHELITLSRREIMQHCPKVGRKSLNELTDLLANAGYTLKG